MTPDDHNDRRVGTPLVPQRPFLHGEPTARRDASTREAAANIARDQLDNIYSGNSRTPTPHTTPVIESTEPAKQETAYERTHTQSVTTIQADQWQRYHSAWQEYYQKYYERYYLHQLHKAASTLKPATDAPAVTAGSQSAPTESVPQPKNILSQTDAMRELRASLLGKLHSTAYKARHSRHFMPVVAALCVMAVFLFLQYNRILIANVQAYISPGNINPANFIVDPSTDVEVGPDPKLIIPKINVDAPANYNTTPDYDSQMKAMENGVAYFGIPGANSLPGQIGNTVLSGHSSNDIIDKGDYKFIFARLDQLDKGDSIYLNYQGKRYTYTVTDKKVVTPTDVSALVYPTTKPILTLITCTPLGTSLNRLLVTAEQVSPDPSTATAAPANGSTATAASMPGNSPTFMQRLFGGGQ